MYNQLHVVLLCSPHDDTFTGEFSQNLPNALEIVVVEGIKPSLSAFVARKIQLSINE